MNLTQLTLRPLCACLPLLSLLWLGPGLLAQPTVSIQITHSSEQGTQVFDTSFVLPPGFDLDDWIEQTQIRKTQLGHTVSTLVVIRDEETQKAEADLYRPAMQEAGTRREAGVMGVVLFSHEGHRRGVTINSVVAGSSAEQIGLRARDTIVGLGDRRVGVYRDLVEAKQGLFAGDSLPIEVRRGDSTLRRVLVLGGRSSSSAVEQPAFHAPRAYLGVFTADLTPDLARDLGLTHLQGVVLRTVVEGSAADRAGLKNRDVIVKMNDRDIDSAWELSDVLQSKRPGDSLRIVYLRQAQPESTLVLLEKRPSGKSTFVEQRPQRRLVQEARPYLGVSLLTHSTGPGVGVTGVEPGGAAELAGLRKGDRILSIGGLDTPDYDHLARVMRQFQPGERVRIVYRRENKTRRTRATLGFREQPVWVRVDSSQAHDPAQIIEAVKERNRREGELLEQNLDAPSLPMAFFELFPNPNSGTFTLNFDLKSKGEVTVKVYDATGKVLLEDMRPDFAGTYRRDIDLRDRTSPGLYLVQVRQGRKSMVQRMIVR